MKLEKCLELIGEEKRFVSVPQALQFFIKEYNKKLDNPKRDPYGNWKKERGIKTAWDLEDKELLEELDKYLVGCELEDPSWYHEDTDFELDSPNMNYEWLHGVDQSDWF